LCRDAGILVPQELLVVGAGDFQALCRAATPSLSSIAVPHRQAGWEAARILDGLMAGHPRPKSPLSLPPGRLHERESTEWVGTGDPLVMEALGLIQRGWLNRRTVAELCRKLACGRRTLERRFRAELGKTVHDALQAHRVKQATAMLDDGVLTVEAIARECGFRTPLALETLLKRKTGRLPRELRRSPVTTGAAGGVSYSSPVGSSPNRTKAPSPISSSLP
jgi:LacI family transcriptional regulator